MNRYELRGLYADAAAEMKRVLVLMPAYPEVCDVFDRLIDLGDDHHVIHRIHQAAGSKLVEFKAGGEIRITALDGSGGARGRVYDVIYIDNSTGMLTSELLVAIAPLTCGCGHRDGPDLIIGTDTDRELTKLRIAATQPRRRRDARSSA